MWMNLVFGLPYLVAVVAGALVCVLAGPKGPGTRTWRVPAVAGFGLLALQHLLQTGQTMALYVGVGSGAYYRSGWYVLLTVLGSILTLVGLVLIAVAVVRGRGSFAPVPHGGWGAPGAPVHAGTREVPAVTPDNPYGQPRGPVAGPYGQPAPTGATEHPEQPGPGR